MAHDFIIQQALQEIAANSRPQQRQPGPSPQQRQLTQALSHGAARAMDKYWVRRDTKYLVRNGLAPETAVVQITEYARAMKFYGAVTVFGMWIWWLISGGGVYLTGSGWGALLLGQETHAYAVIGGPILAVLAVFVFYTWFILVPTYLWRYIAAKGLEWEESLPAWRRVRRPEHLRNTKEENRAIPGAFLAKVIATPLTLVFGIVIFAPAVAAAISSLVQISVMIGGS